jgi:hypothetical protein
VFDRVVAVVVSAGVLACVLLPLSWPASRDSFPLSNYPMFAHERRSAVLNAVYAVALDRGGQRHWVPPIALGTREVLQARALLEGTSMRGRAAVRGLCESIAARLPAMGGELAGAVEVRVVRGSHDAIAYFERGALGPERTLSSCRVPGRQ